MKASLDYSGGEYGFDSNGVWRFMIYDYHRDTYYPLPDISNPFEEFEVTVPWDKIRIKMAERDTNLSGYIGEFKESASLVGSIGKTMWSVVQDLRKLRRGQIPNSLKKAFRSRPGEHEFGKWVNRVVSRVTLGDLADMQIKSAWALSPLLNDLSTASVKIQQGMGNTLFETRNRARRYEEQVKSYDVEFNGLVFSVKQRQYDSHRIVCYSKYQYSDSFNYEPGTLFQAGWEALPWSAVIDWVFPIGNWLQQFGATKNYSDHVGTVATKRIRETFIRCVGGQRDGYSYHHVDPYLLRTTTFTRSPFSLEDLPVIAKLPSFKNPFGSMSHMMTGMALLYKLRYQY